MLLSCLSPRRLCDWLLSCVIDEFSGLQDWGGRGKPIELTNSICKLSDYSVGEIHTSSLPWLLISLLRMEYNPIHLNEMN